MEGLEQIASSEEDRRWCVYIHRNKINNKAYIGIAVNTQKRWGVDGKNYLAKHTDGSYEHPVFAKALMKYKDWNNDWEHIIFQENLTQAEAKHIEVLLIALFQTNCSRYKNPERGYNLTDGGDGVVGYVYTEEIKKKMRKPHPSIQGENHPNYGKTLSDETKNKISESVKIAMQNEEILEKIRQPRPSMQGENNPNYGKPPQERMDEEAYKRWLENLRANILRGENHPLYGTHRESPMLGKHHTEETKEKMRGPRPSVQGENNRNYGRIYSDEEIIGLRKAHAKEMKCIVQLNTNGNVINIYESINSAHRKTGINDQCISFCCQGKYKTAGGYKWKYIYDQIQKDGAVILGAITLGIITEEEVLMKLNTVKGE